MMDNKHDTNLDEIILSLSESERKILEYFAKKKIREAYEEDVSKELGIPLAEVSRGALWLENKNIARRVEEKNAVYVMTDKGEQYLKKPLPERLVLDYLKSHKEVSIEDLRDDLLLSIEELSAAIGLLTRIRAVRVIRKNGKRVIILTHEGEKIDRLSSEDILEIFKKRKSINVMEAGKDLKDLLRRGLIRKITISKWKIVLTDLGVAMINKGIPEVEFIDKLTPEVIARKEWTVKRIRWYDVKAPVPKIWGGRKHPLRLIMERIRRIFIELGFREMRGPWVEIAFWNMDGMWIPQDHPAREMQATFYLDNPSYGYVEDKEIVNIVRKVQETGYDTGSLGWRQPWDEKEAMRTLLRTHTTAVSFRVLGFAIKTGQVKPPAKFFTIDRVFRNETIDWKHLAEFHQVDGFVVGEGLTLRSLMGYLREFYWKMGIKKLRFKPTYNPYTEPSMEVFAWHEDLGKWVEVGNSGIFRPEALRPYGIKYPVIAWGLAIERLAMLLYGIEDIRQILGPMCDVNWLRWYELPIRRVFR
mgnify:CR=1 FL=1